MSEANKNVARGFYEDVFNKKNLDALEKYCAPQFRDHHPMPGQGPGIPGVREVFGMFVGAFPDLKFTVEELIAERDLVVARFTVVGTHKGPVFGAPATGKTVTFHGMDMIRVVDGKATDVWHYGDEMMVLAQLGVKPPV